MSARKKRGVSSEEFMARRAADAVVLAVDAAARSGWAILKGNGGVATLEHHGIAQVFSGGNIAARFQGGDVVGAVRTAVEMARHDQTPIHMYLERTPVPFSGRHLGTWLGIGEARGAWRWVFRSVCDEENLNKGVKRVGRAQILAVTDREHDALLGAWRAATIPAAGFDAAEEPAQVRSRRGPWDVPMGTEMTLDAGVEIRVRVPAGPTTSAAEVAAQVRAAAAHDLVVSSSGGVLRVSTTATGKDAHLVVSGAGAEVLGMAGEARGKDARRRRPSSNEWKALAVERVRELHGVDVTHDVAEAVLIGHYGIRALSER